MDLLDLAKLDEDRRKLATGRLRNGYKVFKGYAMPEDFQAIQKEIEDFEVFDDDIWITAFPKCGTTWCQEMIWCIHHDLIYETTKKELDIRMPYFELSALNPNPDAETPETPWFMRNSLNLAKNMKRPRLIKSHLPFDLLPKQIQNFERRPTIIHICRNIKDSCVSLFHHYKIIEGYHGDFDLFWKLFISDKIYYTPMIDNILSYWKHRSEPNFLFLRFEDMKTDLRSVILNVCKFFNKSFSDDQIDELVEYLSFNSMQNNNYVNKQTTVENLKKIGRCVDKDGKFIRSGKVGGYKNEMNDEVERIFDKYINETLKGTDFTFN